MDVEYQQIVHKKYAILESWINCRAIRVGGYVRRLKLQLDCFGYDMYVYIEEKVSSLLYWECFWLKKEMAFVALCSRPHRWLLFPLQQQQQMKYWVIVQLFESKKPHQRDSAINTRHWQTTWTLDIGGPYGHFIVWYAYESEHYLLELKKKKYQVNKWVLGLWYEWTL